MRLLTLRSLLRVEISRDLLRLIDRHLNSASYDFQQRLVIPEHHFRNKRRFRRVINLHFDDSVNVRQDPASQSELVQVPLHRSRGGSNEGRVQ